MEKSIKRLKKRGVFFTGQLKMDKILIVNQNDEEIGFEDKMRVHREGLLHRAFSVVIKNRREEILIQQRAYSKYHSGGLWSNTCCTHQREGETPMESPHRCLMNELGFDCPITEISTFRYNAPMSNDLIENEFDHLYLGRFDGIPRINPAEVGGIKWRPYEVLREDMNAEPGSYTYWFREIVRKFGNAIYASGLSQRAAT